MYVHKRAKLCFLASPRTASRAVRNAITQPAIGFKQVGAHHDGPDQGHDIQGLTCFCATRNHWDTAISWWYNARMNRKDKKPTLEWFASHFSKNRYYFRAGKMFWFREIPSIITIRYENLEDELNTILEARGLPTVVLPKFGMSKDRLEFSGTDKDPFPTKKHQVDLAKLPEGVTYEKKHYSTYYDGHTRHFVEWCFLPEIKELGYEFEEDPPWQPKQKNSKRP